MIAAGTVASFASPAFEIVMRMQQESAAHRGLGELIGGIQMACVTVRAADIMRRREVARFGGACGRGQILDRDRALRRGRLRARGSRQEADENREGGGRARYFAESINRKLSAR